MPSFLSAYPGSPVLLPLVTRDGGGNLVAATDARYRLRDVSNNIIRAFPGAGVTDFALVVAGVYVAAVTAPATPGAYTYEYEATINGVLLEGEPDVLLVLPQGATSAQVASAQATAAAALQSNDPRLPANGVIPRVVDLPAGPDNTSVAAILSKVQAAFPFAGAAASRSDVVNLGSPAQAAALQTLQGILGNPAQVAVLASVLTAVQALGAPAQAGTVGSPLQTGDARLPATVIAAKADIPGPAARPPLSQG